MQSRKIYVGAVLIFVLCAVAFVTFSGVFQWGNSSRHEQKSRCVAELGKRCVSLREYRSAYHGEIENIESMIKQKLSDNQIRMFGIKEMILKNMVSDIVLEKFAHDIGLRVSAKSVRNLIRSMSVFQDNNGVFDKEKFETLLNNAGLTEGSYTHRVLSALPFNILLECIFPRNDEVAEKYHSSLAKYVLTGIMQNRIVDIVEVSPDAVKELVKDEKASEVELRIMYDQEKDSLEFPEYRSLNYIMVTEDDALDSVEVSDNEVDTEIKNSELHDQRDVLNLVFSNKHEADSAYSAFVGGKTFEDLVRDAGTTIESISVNNITKDVLPVDARSYVFGLKDGEVSEVFRSLMGWHIMKVVKRHLISDEDLSELKKKVSLNLRRQKAHEVLSLNVKRANEMISRGSSLEEVKSFFVSPVGGVLQNFDVQGHDAEGNTVEFPTPSVHALVSLAFSSQLNEPSHLVNVGDAYFGVLVTEVVAPRPKTYEESKDALMKIWKDSMIKKKMIGVASDLAIKLKNGVELGDIEGVYVKRNQTIRKTGDHRDNSDQYPAQLSEMVFSMTMQGSVSQEVYDSGKVYVARLNEIRNSDITEKELQEFQKHVINGNVLSLKDQLLSYLISKYKVKINDDLLRLV